MFFVSSSSSALLLISCFLLLSSLVFVFVEATDLPNIWSVTLSSASAASYTAPFVGPITSSSSNILVVGSKTENSLVVLQTSDGAQLFSTAAAGRVNQQPTIYCLDNDDRNTCVVLAPSNSLNLMTVFNATTGAQITTRSTTRVLETSPGAVLDSSSSSGANSSLLTCTGDTSFQVAGDNLTLSSSNGGTASTTTFSSLWSTKLNQRPSKYCEPLTFSGKSYFSVGSVLGDYFLLDAITGAQVWKTNIRSQVNTRPVFFNDVETHGEIIILGTRDGFVHVLNRNTGASIYSVSVSTVSDGIQALALNPKSKMIVVGDESGVVHGVSLRDGQKKFQRKLSSQRIVSLVPLFLSSSQSSLAAQKLQLSSSSNVALIAGAANRLFFTIQVSTLSNNDEVKVVFSHSTATSSLTGGISTDSSSSSNNDDSNNCIFGSEVGSIRCINQTRVLEQVHPSNFNVVDDDSSGLPAWAQIVIIVSSIVIVAIIVAIVVILFVLPRYREQTDEEAIERRRQARLEEEQHREAMRVARIARAEQEQALRQYQRNNNHNHQNNNGANMNARIFETNFTPANQNNNNNLMNNHETPDEQELTRIAAAANQNLLNNDDDNQEMNNNNNNNLITNQQQRQQSSGTFINNTRLQLPIFTNRLEMINAKTESTPASEMDLTTVSYLSENFAYPISRDITELMKVSSALGVDILDCYYGCFVFAGRHSDLIICKTRNNDSSNTTNNHHYNESQRYSNPDRASSSSSSRYRDLKIPPTLHCVLGFVPSVRDVGWIVIDTELLLAMPPSPHQILSTTTEVGHHGNPLDDNNNSSSNSKSHHHHQHDSLQNVLRKTDGDHQSSLTTKSYTCSVCFDTIEIHRLPQQTSLILGSVCSSFSPSTTNGNDDTNNNNCGIHFTCGSCLSGSTEQILDKGKNFLDLQFIPCYHPSCVEKRAAAANNNNIENDESGYFVFDDFSSVLKPATLRRWQKVSTEAGRTMGQKEVASAFNNKNNNNHSSSNQQQQVQDHCLRIRALLRPRCPHCGMEFLSFTGCVSITCGVRRTDAQGAKGERVAGCGRNFCGSCMEARPCSGGHGHDFMNQNVIQQNWKVWRNRKVNAYLADHFSTWRQDERVRGLLQRVLRNAVTDLMEAGIWPLQSPWCDVVAK